MNFLVNSVNELLAHFGLHSSFAVQVALPIGVSFIVFEKITYAVDIYRGKGKSAPTIFHYLIYVFLFPKLLAGPIVKYHDIEGQLLNHQPSADDFISGFRRFIIGLAKKVFLADTLAEFADPAFGTNPVGLSTIDAWLGVACFTLQIYYDFSGYSDMAIGMARMMGFKLSENFNFPYVSASFSEFWRRWHISLSSWIKEYLYIPMGGSKCPRWRVYLNLWTCFLLSGLWHGASWNFVIWGAYNGCFLIFDRLFWETRVRLPRLVKVGVTLILVMIGWIIFRAKTIDHAIIYVKSLFVYNGPGTYVDLTPNITAALIFGGLMSLLPLIKFRGTGLFKEQATASRVLEGFTVASLALLAAAKCISVTFNPFLYFRF